MKTIGLLRMCAVNEAAITVANCLQDSGSLPSARLATPLITIHSTFKSCAAENRPAKDFVNKTAMEVNRVKSLDLSSHIKTSDPFQWQDEGMNPKTTQKISLGA